MFEYLDIRAKRFPHMHFTTELLTTLLIQTICPFKDLVKIKREKGIVLEKGMV